MVNGCTPLTQHATIWQHIPISSDLSLKKSGLAWFFVMIRGRTLEFGAFQAAESARWKQLIESRKITAD